MSFGLTPAGFNKMRLEDVKALLEQKFIETFGSVRTDPESHIGQLIGIIAFLGAMSWEQLENIYTSRTIAAEGTALDDVVSYNGITRLDATKTSVLVAMYATTFPTTIPSDTIVRDSLTSTTFLLRDTTDIEKDNVIDAVLSIDATSAGAYTITINTIAYTYTSDGSKTKQQIVQELVSLINAADIGVEAIELTEQIQVLAEDRQTAFSIDEDSNTSLEIIGTNGFFECSQKGAFPCTQGAVTLIDTPVANLDSVVNLLAGNTGRPIESDAALRTRRAASIRVAGTAAIDAIRARLQQYVPDISQAFVFENDSDTVDSAGRPPHSIHCVVSGPVTAQFKADVASVIFASKAGGIQTFGAISETVLDSQGESHTINFDYPINKYFWAIVTITPSGEEQLPDDYQVQIRDALLKYGASLQIGADILYQKLFTPIYSIPGVASVILQIAVTDTEGGTPSYVTTNISIDSAAVAVFAASRITVS